jgi:hypothetical protein
MELIAQKEGRRWEHVPENLLQAWPLGKKLGFNPLRKDSRRRDLARREEPNP